MTHASCSVPAESERQARVLSRACQGDLDAVMEIERLSFPNPWVRQAFADELDRPWARLEILRQSADGKVVGFCNYWLVMDELHILNVAVHPDQRRQGHASFLLHHILDEARSHQTRIISLEVRASNAAAQALYDKLGFRRVGKRPRYYPDGEDAVLMDLSLSGS